MKDRLIDIKPKTDNVINMIKSSKFALFLIMITQYTAKSTDTKNE